jgi:hypothetical protein
MGALPQKAVVNLGPSDFDGILMARCAESFPPATEKNGVAVFFVPMIRGSLVAGLATNPLSLKKREVLFIASVGKGFDLGI